MFIFKKRKILVTHSGSFHSDDIFACATISLFLEKNDEKFFVIRTRDEKIIENADYVFDVGGIYDAEKNRFDHHQKGGAGKREDNIEYSSFGLVWKKFGKEICGSDEIVKMIDTRLVSPVDAFDNGMDLVENKYEVSPYFIQHFFFSMRPTSKENKELNDVMFLKAVEIAKEVLQREKMHAEDVVLSKKNILSIYEKTEDKKILVLNDHFYDEEVLSKLPEPLYIVYPKSSDDSWGVKAVREGIKTFNNRKNFPKNWSGLRDLELQKITGVSDAIFCHKGLFLAGAKSKEGAIKLAQIAVADSL